MAGISDVFGRLQPGAGVVERRGPDPQGADVRADQRRGQPRRGRQGVLVVPRRYAEQRLAPLALPLPAGRVSLRGPDRGERPAVQAGAGVRAARHRHLRRRPLLDRRGRLREGRSDRRADADHGPQRGARGGDAPRAADDLVPQQVVVRPGRPPADAGGRGRRVADPASHPELGDYELHVGAGPDGAPPELLFCENETNAPADLRRRRRPRRAQGRHQRPRRERRADRQPGRDRDQGRRMVPPRRSRPGETRGDPAAAPAPAPGARRPAEAVDPAELLGAGVRRPRWRPREAEADEFYAELGAAGRDRRRGTIMRQAFAGMLWSKQYYGYDVARWLDGDPAAAAARRAADRAQRGLAPLRRRGHPVDARPVGVPLVRGLGPRLPHGHARPRRPGVREVPAARHVPGVVPASQRRPAGLRVGVRRRQPAGPCLAALAVWQIDGRRDTEFLQRIFHKLLLNFTWWLNRQDAEGNDLFSGGFLGLDNIERVRPLAHARRRPARAVRRHGMDVAYCLSMLRMARSLAERDPAYRGPPGHVPRARGPNRRGP